MIELILNMCVVVLFATLAAAFGYCAWTTHDGVPFIAAVFQACCTGAFAVYAIREYLK